MLIGSDESLPVKGASVHKLASRSAILREENLDEVREYLKELAKPLCKTAGETPLPPLRAINHRINLINEDMVYPWRASRCPEAFMSKWVVKRNEYIATGRWETTSARNVVPMMFIPKAAKPGKEPEIRTPVDLRPRNANTIKMSSPLPDIDGIMRRVSSHRYVSLLDQKDVYEQMRIQPEDVWKTAFSTPNGTWLAM